MGTGIVGRESWVDLMDGLGLNLIGLEECMVELMDSFVWMGLEEIELKLMILLDSFILIGLDEIGVENTCFDRIKRIWS